MGFVLFPTEHISLVVLKERNREERSFGLVRGAGRVKVDRKKTAPLPEEPQAV